MQVLEHRAEVGHIEATAELQAMRSALDSDRACSMQAMQEGRSVAVALPKNSALVQKAEQCQPRMLVGLEELVLRESMKATDAATLSSMGLYFSDIGLAAGQAQSLAPLFGAGPKALYAIQKFGSSWSEDARGFHAPAELVNAEALLLQGEEASSGTERGDRGATRALRLYQHGKLLALKHHDDAAEWRYREAAEIAATFRRAKLAAHALGRLGYFLSLRGRKIEALEVINKAVSHAEDPLATYMQASLRRSLGELRGTEEIRHAEKQLGAVAGQLPSKTLEEQRAAAHAEVRWWGVVNVEGLHTCLKAWDASYFLICVLSGLIFKSDESSREKGE
jgi:hypothetical protein